MKRILFAAALLTIPCAALVASSDRSHCRAPYEVPPAVLTAAASCDASRVVRVTPATEAAPLSVRSRAGAGLAAPSLDPAVGAVRLSPGGGSVVANGTRLSPDGGVIGNATRLPGGGYRSSGANRTAGGWTGRPAEFWTLAPHAHGEVAIVATTDSAASSARGAAAPRPLYLEDTEDIATPPAASRDDAATTALRAAARAVSDCWRRGAAAEADALIAATPQLVAWDRSGGAVQVAGWFRRNGNSARLGVTVERSKGATPVGVVFPPGTYGVAPGVQDLALLRAAIVVLGPEERSARVEFPVACASFHEGAPLAGQAYTLGRYPADSAIARFLAALCAGDPAPEAAAQLGIWITANRVTHRQVALQRRLRTFDTFQPVGVAQAEEAAELIRRAGLEPAHAPFYAPRSAGEVEPGEEEEGGSPL